MSNKDRVNWLGYSFTVYSIKNKNDVKYFKSVVSSNDDFKGIYIFTKTINSHNYAVYIGQSETVVDRILDHIDNPIDKNDKKILKYSDNVLILEKKSSPDRDLLEKCFIGSQNPPLNYDHRTNLAPKEISGPVPDRRKNKQGKFE